VLTGLPRTCCRSNQEPKSSPKVWITFWIAPPSPASPYRSTAGCTCSTPRHGINRIFKRAPRNTRDSSFPRKREPRKIKALDSRLRGNDEFFELPKRAFLPFFDASCLCGAAAGVQIPISGLDAVFLPHHKKTRPCRVLRLFWANPSVAQIERLFLR